MHPNTWRYITAYMDRCRELGRAASIGDFVQLHSVVKVPGENGLHSLKSEVKSKWKHPDSISDWRRKWLLVRPPVGVSFPVSFGAAQKIELPVQTAKGVGELKRMFATLAPEAAPQPSGLVFDGPFLEVLGLSLAHFPLCKPLVPFSSIETLLCFTVADVLLFRGMQSGVSATGRERSRRRTPTGVSVPRRRAKER